MIVFILKLLSLFKMILPASLPLFSSIHSNIILSISCFLLIPEWLLNISLPCVILFSSFPFNLVLVSLLFYFFSFSSFPVRILFFHIASQIAVIFLFLYHPYSLSCFWSCVFFLYESVEIYPADDKSNKRYHPLILGCSLLLLSSALFPISIMICYPIAIKLFMFRGVHYLCRLLGSEN